MKNAKISVAELLTTIRDNRTKHRAIFLEAQQGFRTKLIEELDKRLAEARAGKAVKGSLHIPEPSDHTSDYDTIIRMLEMTSSDEVELNSDEFSQYVMDDWSWKRQFLHSNSAYSVTAAGAMAEQGEDY